MNNYSVCKHISNVIYLKFASSKLFWMNCYYMVYGVNYLAISYLYVKIKVVVK